MGTWLKAYTVTLSIGMTGMGVGARFQGPQPVSMTAANRKHAGRIIIKTKVKIALFMK